MEYVVVFACIWVGFTILLAVIWRSGDLTLLEAVVIASMLAVVGAVIACIGAALSALMLFLLQLSGLANL